MTCTATGPAAVVPIGHDPSHWHTCTGPEGHDGNEHLCPCSTWWRVFDARPYVATQEDA